MKTPAFKSSLPLRTPVTSSELVVRRGHRSHDSAHFLAWYFEHDAFKTPDDTLPVPQA